MMNTHATLVIGLSMLLSASQAKGQASFPDAEIKWTVPAALIPHAKEVLGLKADDAKQEEVWFFDTADQTLKQKEHLVLRARREGKDIDSTVKLRLNEPEDVAKITSSPDGKVEWDVGVGTKSLSHSEGKEGLDKDLLEKALKNGEVKKLFSAEGQQRLLAAAKTLDWSQVKRYGPVKAEVWKNKKDKPKKVNMPGYDKITAELWHLEKDGTHLDILELSIKTSGTAAEVDAQAKAFFAAASKLLVSAEARPAAGDTTKTTAVLDFFAPGK